MTLNHTSPVDTQAELDAYIASLPVDDEPLSPEDEAAIADGRAAAARGEVLTHAQLQQQLAIVGIVESVEGGSYLLWQLHTALVAQSIIPAGWSDTQTKKLLDEMVSDEMIAGRDEPGEAKARYWQHGRSYQPLA